MSFMNWRDVPASLQEKIKDFFDRHPEWNYDCIQSTVYDFDSNRSRRLNEMARHYDDCTLSEALKALSGDQEMVTELKKREASRNELWELAGQFRQLEKLPMFV